jgi:hypothetical protein
MGTVAGAARDGEEVNVERAVGGCPDETVREWNWGAALGLLTESVARLDRELR